MHLRFCNKEREMNNSAQFEFICKNCGLKETAHSSDQKRVGLCSFCAGHATSSHKGFGEGLKETAEFAKKHFERGASFANKSTLFVQKK